jgi:hypothetical protein
MNRQELSEMLETLGWKRDAFGHYKKTGLAINAATGERTEVVRRVKFQAISVRLEKRVLICGTNEWRPISHAYIKDVCLADGMFKGVKALGLKIGHVMLNASALS